MKKNSSIYYTVAVFLSLVILFLCSSSGDTSDFMPHRQEIEIAQPVIAVEVKPMIKPSKTVMWQMQFLPFKDYYLNAHEDKVNGVAMGYFLPQREVNGVSVALMHAYNEHKRGVSLSLVEYSGESDGLAMFLAGGMRRNNGFSVALLNMTESNNGLQLGLINQEETNLLFDYDLKPKEVNERFGVQAGVINYSDAPGIQFGLWNTNPNSWIKHFPLINFCF